MSGAPAETGTTTPRDGSGAHAGVRVLGIETSCDETSAAVVSLADGRFTLESCVILSQDVHRLFGGVVPEIASRQHLVAIEPVVRGALAEAGVSVDECDAIAVTNAPGLVGALLVGVHYAKGLGLAHDVPVLPAHHMEGHLVATALEHPEAVPPFTALLVSGGHTLIVDVAAWGAYRVLGRTRDDAAGEAFDKVAKLMGLPYPGGRHIEALAAADDADADPAPRLRFTRPMLRADQLPGDDDYCDVSFSGLKTAVRLEVEAHGIVPDPLPGTGSAPADADSDIDALPGAAAGRARARSARAFQAALVDTLVAKTLRAARMQDRPRIVLGGGVACNGALQRAMREAAHAEGRAVYAPSPRFATDNAAMIAAIGALRFAAGERAPDDFPARAAAPLPTLPHALT